jgi:hypothetical protein
LLADPHDDESRFFAVELDQTALQQDLATPAARRGAAPEPIPPIPTGRLKPAVSRRPTSRWC